MIVQRPTVERWRFFAFRELNRLNGVFMMRNGPQGSESSSLEDQLIEALPRLRLYAKSLAPTFVDADDLVSRTCMRILEHRNRYNPEHPLLPWAIRILKNIFIDEWRAQKKRNPEHGTVAMSLVADPLSQSRIESNLELKNVDRLIHQLPEEQREVLVLKGGGQSYKEIAALLEIPMGTVMSRLKRGREALSKLMEAV